MSVRSGRKRLLFGVLAATILVAITSVPSTVGAAPSKQYSLNVSKSPIPIPTPTLQPTTATAGIPTDFYVRMTNKTPGNSNPNSFSVYVPFAVASAPTASILRPPDSSNANASTTNPLPVVQVSTPPGEVGNFYRVDVKSLDPVKTDKFVTIKITATPATLPSGTCSKPYTWSAKVWTGSSLNGDQFGLTGPSQVTTTIESCFPSLSITKTAVETSISVGDDAKFDITVTNSGAGPATGVVVTDTLPTDAGLTWSIDVSSDAGCSIGSGLLTCTFGTLNATASKTVRITSATTSATVADSPIENSAHVTATNGSSPPDASASVEVLGAGLSVTKEADDEGAVVAGEAIGYTITVHNSGPGAAKNVDLSDTLPTDTGLDWSIESETADSCTDPIVGGVLSCNIGTLAGGSSYTVHITSPTSTDMVGLTISNTATVTATNVTPDPGSDSDSITLFAGILDCGDVASQGGDGTPASSLERLVNVSTGCTPIPFTLDSRVEGDVQFITLHKDLLGQAAQFFWTVTWVPETGQWPETVTQFDFDFDDVYQDIKHRDGDGDDEGEFPDQPQTGEPWCLVKSSTELQVGGPNNGRVVVTETYFGSGDPGGKRG